MSNETKKKVVEILLNALFTSILLIAAGFGYNVTVLEPLITEGQAEGRGSGITRFNTDVQFLNSVTVTGNTTVGGTLSASDLAASDDLTVTDDFAVTDDTTLTGDLAVTGAVTFSSNPIMSSESITPTDGGTLTPVASIVTLTPAGALGTALAACTTGQKTTLYNSINASVVITDTGNFIGAGNATLTQFDTLSLVCIATKWVQIGTVPNN